MAREKEPINTIRGKRLKTLISDTGMSQHEFADKVGYSKEHISYIINGRRELKEDAARRIVSLFPSIRIEWLLGYDEFKTEMQKITAPLADAIVNLQFKKDAFKIHAALAGYNVSMVDESSNSATDISELPVEKTKDYICSYMAQLDKVFYVFSDKNGVEIARITANEYTVLLDDIEEFIEYKINKICKKRGGQNG